MSTTAVVTRVPVTKTPEMVYKEMTPTLRKIVDALDDRVKKVNSFGVMLYYDMGDNVKKITEAAEEGDRSYGKNPIEQMAVYYGHQANTLYGARQLARVFKRDFVLAKTQEAAKKNFTLSYNHWLQLSRIPSQARRDELLAQCIKQRWSHSMLGDQANASGDQTQHHRAGGRPPAVPKDPVPAMLKLKKLSGLFSNYANEAEETINNGLLDIPPDAVSAMVTDPIDETITSLEETASATNLYLASLRDVRLKLGNATKAYKKNEKTPAKKGAKAGRR